MVEELCWNGSGSYKSAYNNVAVLCPPPLEMSIVRDSRAPELLKPNDGEHIRMGIAYLFVIHSTCKEQYQGDEHHCEQALICSKVLQSL